MRRISTYLALAGMSMPLTAWTGHETRGGGDIVHCERSLQNELEGTYTLDYVLTYQNLNQHPENELQEIHSWPQSRDRIGSLLRQKIPTFYGKYKNFVDHMDNFHDYSRDRIWKQSPYKLIDISDEDFLVILPKNCYKKYGTKINIVQAIIQSRNTETGFVNYLFYEPIYRDLLQNHPDQFSFMMIHEWLWDFFDPSQINRMRDVNRLLHSRQLELLTPAKLWRSLRNLGISLQALGPQPSQDNVGGPLEVRVNKLRSCLRQKDTIHCWGAGQRETEVKNAKAFVLFPNMPYGLSVAKDGTFTGLGASVERDPIHDWNVQSLVRRYGVDSRSTTACAVTKYSGAMCWSSYSSSSVQPKRLNLVSPTSLRLGPDYYCGMSLHGLRCGSQYSRRDVSFVETYENQEFASLEDYALGKNYACFIDDGKLKCFYEDQPDTDIPDFYRAQSVKVSTDYACAIGDQQLECWDITKEGSASRDLLEVPLVDNPQQFDLSSSHGCVVDDVGVQCWGEAGKFLNVPKDLYPLR